MSQQERRRNSTRIKAGRRSENTRLSTIAIVTDHRFFSQDGLVSDDFVFGRDFFSDYLDVFGRVLVVARSKNRRNGGVASEERGVVDFLLVKGREIGVWMQIVKAIWAADAVCFRLPSFLAIPICTGCKLQAPTQPSK